tara:strand:+ start:336 stop:488 length:153 start_codon:yes stop_codon:yes gene_type:complete
MGKPSDSIPEPKFKPLTNIKKTIDQKNIPSAKFIDELYSKEFINNYFAKT